MKLHWIDVTILVVYLLGIAVIGFLLKRKASKNLKEPQGVPAGGQRTAVVHAQPVERARDVRHLRDDVASDDPLRVRPQERMAALALADVQPVFLMVYLSQWLRRSKVTTGGQWNETRFGRGLGSRLSHTIVVVFALIGRLSFLAHGFVDWTSSSPSYACKPAGRTRTPGGERIARRPDRSRDRGLLPLR